MVKIIVVEGNIGAGKSSLLELLQKKMTGCGKRIGILKEPIEVWESIKDKEGKNILELFYENPSKYAFEFQMIIFTTIYHAIQEQSKYYDILVCERSLDSNIEIFGQMLLQDGLLSQEQMAIFRWMADNYKVPIFQRVFLNTNAYTCHIRVKWRNRKGEENISLEYLQKIDHYHHAFFKKNPDYLLINSDSLQDEWISSLLNEEKSVRMIIIIVYHRLSSVFLHTLHFFFFSIERIEKPMINDDNDDKPMIIPPYHFFFADSWGGSNNLYW
jgi:deoxyadenosine/deoxycytidine kinase